MGKLKSFFFYMTTFSLLAGCASGHCRGRAVASDQKVFVYKPDGSLQCGKKNGMSADEMAEQLKEIKVYSRENKHDGQMHMTLCGTATGRINVYEIDMKDLGKARSLGFMELKNDN